MDVTADGSSVRKCSAGRLLFMMTALMLVCAAAVMVIGDSDDSNAISETFTVDGIRYTTTSDNTVKVISNSPGYSGSVTVPSGVTYSKINYSVTSIGDEAFYNCTSLTSVTIGDSVTSIGDWAFNECTSLASVTIGNSVTSIGHAVFCNCISLTSATIGNSVTSIDGSAFDGCTSLAIVTVSNRTVPSLSGDPFSDCTALSEILVPSGSVDSYKAADIWSTYADRIFSDISACTVEDIKDIPWTGMPIEPDVTVKDGDVILTKDTHYTVSYGKNTDIGTGTVTINGINDYRGCYIKTFYIVEMWDISATGSDDVALLYNDTTRVFTVSGTGAMKDYSYDKLAPWSSPYKDKVRTIIIEDGVTYVGAYAFYDCTNVSSLKAGKSLETIGSNAFRNCTSLSSVSLSEGVTTIRDNAFAQCSSLTSFTVPDSVTTIESNAFEKSGLVSVDIPAKTSFIGPCAFATDTLTQITVSDDNVKYCSEDGVLFNKHKVSIECYPAGRTAKSYSIPDTVLSIQMSAFRYCSHLESVTVPSGVEAIPSYAFCQCTSLKSVTVSGYAEYFDDNAFADCTSLSSITVMSRTVPSLKENSFSNCSAIREILVPSGSVDSYKAAKVWSSYADRIFAGIALCTVDDIADRTFSGSQITPSVVVRDGGVALVEGTHYTVSYGENIDVGEGSVTITGIGSYAGSVTKTFNIVQENSSGSNTGVWIALAVLILITVGVLVYAVVRKDRN